MSKEVKTSSGVSDFYLSILEELKQGLRPSKICSKLGISKQALNYYLSSLKASGLIQKIGYGVWEVKENVTGEEVKISTHVAKGRVGDSFTSLKQDTVRGHGFVFRFKLPTNLRNWERRAELLSQLGIKFEPLKVFGGGQKISFRGRNIWLTNKSIVIYEKESFIAELASESQSKAINHFIGLLRALEKHLQANFQIHSSRFKVSRQHYALIKNALAKQYDEEGKKLEVYSGEGLWFLIDNSFNLNEAETVHPKTAVEDNKKVQDFFNGLKQVQGFTPQFVTNSLGQMSAGFNLYAQNIESHIKAIQQLGEGVLKLTKLVEEMKK